MIKSILVTLTLTSAAALATEQPLAFPGAQGFAAHATGGRGGEVYHVTTRADSGPGSLRDAVRQGPRIVVFDVGGYIELKSNLIVGSDLTIAGQTAPGDGIGTRNYEISFNGVHNVIFQYIRFRQGTAGGEQQSKKSSINILSCKDIMIDHVSVQWGRWDTIDMNLSQNVTVENCIIGPGVSPQRFGCLCQSDGVTWTHNLWISNQSRNPKAKGHVQYINNIVYNWGSNGYVGGHSATDHPADLINNYFIAGPSSSKSFVGEFKPTDHIFQAGNFLDDNRDGALNGRKITNADFGSGAEAPTLMPAKTITDDVPLKIDSAADAYTFVIAHAGDSIKRDEVDARLIADVKTLGKEGKTIEDQSEVGGYGEIKSGPLTPIPAASADAKTLDANGYSPIERYLSKLVGDNN